MSRAAELGFDFPRERLGGGDVPLRQEARMDHGGVPRDVDHRAASQPVEQVIPIRRGEHFPQRVVLAALDMALGERQQMQIVIAEHDHGAISEIAHEAHGRERGRAAVDQVADEPQVVVRTIEPEGLEQRLQFVEAALNVADRVGCQPIPPGRSRCGG